MANRKNARLKNKHMKREFHLDEIDAIAAELWKAGKQCPVWVFDGDMGAGKTTLIAALCRHLGVRDTVGSPTYALVNEYHFQDKDCEIILYHSDWYRLSGEDEAIESGLEDLFSDTKAYCFIEWPQKAARLLPEKVFRISLRNIDESTRLIETE